MIRKASPRARSGHLGTLFLLATLAASCVSTPKPAEVLACGFRSPEQTFRTFQVAVRADEPSLEYRCFSGRFRADNHVSQLVWREVREQLWGRIGMRWAVAKAEPEAPPRIVGDHAELSVTALGKHVKLRFVREGFGELWSGDKLVYDDELDFRKQSGTQEGAAGKHWFFGQVELPEGSEPANVSELRLGREWKLDDIEFPEGS